MEKSVRGGYPGKESPWGVRLAEALYQPLTVIPGRARCWFGGDGVVTDMF